MCHTPVHVLPLYLGTPVHIPRATPGQRSHPVVQDLVNRLQKRLAPLRWLTNNAAGISIPVATAIYVTFIRSVVDYLSPALSQLPRASLQPLETFQNEAMRVILGCHVSTRIVNMRTELNLPPITERIYSMVTCFTLKCLHSPRITPYYSQVIRHALGQRPRVPPIQPGGRTLVRTICSIIRRLDIDVPEEDDVPGPPPWLQFSPEVCYTPTSKAALPVLQRQLALETIAALSSSVPEAHHVYTDGSVQADDRAGSAVFSPDTDPPPGGWVGRRLPDSSSSTFCELYGILDAVSLLSQRGLSGVVICDSKSALLALSSAKPTCRQVVLRILSFLALLQGRDLKVKFLWIPSHIGLAHSDTVDAMAKAACRLDPRDAGPSPSLSCYISRIRAAAFLPTTHLTDHQRVGSVSIRHYDAFRCHRFKYRRRGLVVRRHNVVSARLRLGYRPVWQVAGDEGEPRFSSCPLCHSPRADTLDHYCLHCPVVRDVLPQDQPLLDVCRHLLDHDNLEELLVRFPRFGGR